ncbi:MAG: putative Fe-S cluster assembly protein SufT [Myxococcaceae bacterium]|nr:putative Fe-S cluster assembly protein SufT [Myxococcaceae bacterium]MBH2006173.1 putative Fe-S cluster assembly protein SufT [Myxococcaceae bacterium]
MYGGGVNVQLSRDCVGIQIPNGDSMTLEQGHEVYITQVLGGMFTVETEWGYLVRIDGKDADALGQTVPEERQKPNWEQYASLEEAAWAQLRTCYDPEIPVNIVELGLVYELEILGSDLRVQMTLTAPGCGMGEVLKNDIETKLREIPGIETVIIDLTFDPPWSTERMSDAARLQLGMM